MRVLITSTGREGKDRENPVSVREFGDSLEKYGSGRYEIAADAADADIVLFIEPCNYRMRPYRETLLINAILGKHPEKCFVYDYSDLPVGFLPGVYSGMPKSRMDRSKFRSGGYLCAVYNQYASELAEQRDQPTKLLASFRGSESHSARAKLFAADLGGSRIAITRTYAWFNHSEDEKRAYVEEMLRSKFVLCPRGVAPTSIRLFETMQLGRAPVVISDDWAPPDGPNWSAFSLHIPERSIGSIDAVLSSREDDAGKMGNLARAAWEQWFAPDVQIGRVIEYVESIMSESGVQDCPRDYAREWNSLSFNAHYAMTMPRRIAGAIVRKAKRRK